MQRSAYILQKSTYTEITFTRIFAADNQYNSLIHKHYGENLEMVRQER